MMSEAETQFLAAITHHRKTSSDFTLRGPNKRAALTKSNPPEIFEVTRVPRFNYTPQFVVSHPMAINWLAIALSILLNASKIRPWMFKYFGYFKLQIEDSNAHNVIYRLIERSYSTSVIDNEEEIDRYIDTIELPKPSKILYDLAKQLKIEEQYLYAFGVLATQASSLTEILGLSKTPKLLMELIDANYASNMLEEETWIILGRRPASTTGSTFIDFDYDIIFDQEKEEEEEEELDYERRIAKETRAQMIQHQDQEEDIVQEDSVQEDGAQEDSVQEDIVQEDSVQEDSVQEDVVQENSGQEDVVQENSGQEDSGQEDGVQEDVDSGFVSTPWWNGVQEDGGQEDGKKRPHEVIDLTGEDHKHNNLEERKKPRSVELVDLTGDDDE